MRAQAWADQTDLVISRPYSTADLLVLSQYTSITLPFPIVFNGGWSSMSLYIEKGLLYPHESSTEQDNPIILPGWIISINPHWPCLGVVLLSTTKQGDNALSSVHLSIRLDTGSVCALLLRSWACRMQWWAITLRFGTNDDCYDLDLESSALTFMDKLLKSDPDTKKADNNQF